MDARTVIKALEANGFVYVRSNGSHRIYKSPYKDHPNVNVPFHGHKDLHPKTLSSIEKASGLSFRG